MQMDLRAPEEVERFGEPSILQGAEVIQHSRESRGRWSPVVVGSPSSHARLGAVMFESESSYGAESRKRPNTYLSA